MAVRFETFFRASSYATVACGALALAVAGGMGAGLAAGFVALLIAAWALEETRWQLPERAGLVVVLLSLPAFYLDWQYLQRGGGVEAGPGVSALVHLTLFLSAVKLLQVKADRDWLFLYLISFFEVLLAAGLSVSPLFVAALGLYLFCTLLSAICFELRKARRLMPERETRLLFSPSDARGLFAPLKRASVARPRRPVALRRLPVAALFLLGLIFALALPIFFITPRFGDSAFSYAGEQATGYVGFSDNVSLGDIGRLQRSDRLVMRVRVEAAAGASPTAQYLRWRGVTLDRFDGRAWRRSSNESRVLTAGEHDLFQLGTTENLNRLTRQTFFIEPVDTPVLFAAARPVAVQGALDFVRIYDEGDALTTRRGARERITYRVYSDTVEPAPDVLRVDGRRYDPSVRNSYLQLPSELDRRIPELALRVIGEAGARNRYDVARAVEAHLNRNEFGGAYSYTLEDLPGGEDPLADFLFRARAGHCEYFSTTMAVMLRTQGIAARVVNGFQMGEYNAAAGAYVVRQHDAHSWVEVYFPETDSWVEFDPTPVAGRPGSVASAGWGARLRAYADAFELFWIQYVVAYDRQEQRTLAGSLRRGIASYREALVRAAEGIKESLSALWDDAPADRAGESRGRASYAPPLLAALIAGALILLIARGWRRIIPRPDRGGSETSAGASTVAFYERMTRALEVRGHARAPHQTPLEFAAALGSPAALLITDAYNRIRFGNQSLTDSEAADIERYLREMEGEAVNSE